MRPALQILFPLALTVFLEGSLFALIRRSFSGQLALLACNLITNPLLNVCLLLVGGGALAIAVGEGLVFLCEALLLARLLPTTWKAALGWSFLCNAFSFACGALLFFL